MMSQEELTLILDTVKSVADTAGVAGITWIGVHYFVQLVTVAVGPVCSAIVLTKAAKHIAAALAAKRDKAAANEIERTRQRELELEKTKVEFEKLTAENAKHAAVKQLVRIAESAGVSHSQYSGIYHDADLLKIIEKVKKT